MAGEAKQSAVPYVNPRVKELNYNKTKARNECNERVKPRELTDFGKNSSGNSLCAVCVYIKTSAERSEKKKQNKH